MNTERLFAGAFGGVLGIALLKFGNPVVLERLVEPPRDALEFIFQPWPARWGYFLLLIAGLLAIPVIHKPARVPKWVLMLPMLWLTWQGIAATATVDSGLTWPTLVHFGMSVVCFYLGILALGRSRHARGLWTGLLVGFALVLWTGFEQHYGGLEATRRMFYEQPNWQQFPQEYLKKIQSNRIFASLVYPNALAAAIILLGPSLLWAAWGLLRRISPVGRAILVGLLAYAALACLYWSGSKSGWLIALIMLLMVLGRFPLPARVKGWLILGVIIVGLAGFFFKYSAYFHRGAPSVSARFEYWRAATRTALENPILGTGPGTFSVAYRKIKPPEAEMAQLVHNDYLEQASDSGMVGALAYAGFTFLSVLLLPRFRPVFQHSGALAIWLGLLGWSLQSFVEFPLYIPALAWPAFTFLGWLWACPAEQYEFDSRGSP